MKSHVSAPSTLAGLLLGAAVALSETATWCAGTVALDPGAESPGPRIRFANPILDFGRVKSGDTVKKDFVFTNVGSATLEILSVRPSCSCTTTKDWDREVEPGKTGKIPILFNTTGFGGKVWKPATVICNDPSRSNVLLQIQGVVWKPIDAMPSMLYFHMWSESLSNQTKVIRLVNNLEKSVQLGEPQCAHESFQARLETVQPGKEFNLHITAIPPFSSNPLSVPVILKTSLPEMPILRVSAYVMVQNQITVNPDFIGLAAGPLTKAMHPGLVIRNQGTNTLVLSDPKMNVPGVAVQVRELQPGRLFNVTLEFPQGFELQPGQNVEFTVKSNHPQYPLIRVPVIPAARRVSPVVKQSTPSTRVIPTKPVP